MSKSNKGPKQRRRKPTNAESKAKRAKQQMARNRNANALKGD